MWRQFRGIIVVVVNWRILGVKTPIGPTHHLRRQAWRTATGLYTGRTTIRFIGAAVTLENGRAHTCQYDDQGNDARVNNKDSHVRGLQLCIGLLIRTSLVNAVPDGDDSRVTDKKGNKQAA